MKYEAVASNHKSPESQMLRRLVSKFNVELPPGLSARLVHALQRRRYASDGRAGAVFVHPPL